MEHESTVQAGFPGNIQVFIDYFRDSFADEVKVVVSILDGGELIIVADDIHSSFPREGKSKINLSLTEK